MLRRVSKAVSCLLVLCVLLSSSGGTDQAWAVVTQAPAGVKVSPAAFPVAAILADSLNTLVSSGVDLSDALGSSADTRLKLALFLEMARDSADSGEARIAPPSALAEEEASRNLEAFGQEAGGLHYHSFRGGEAADSVAEKVSPKLSGGVPADVSAASEPTALEAVKGRIGAAIDVLRPAVERRADAEGSNPWGPVFDNLRARIESGEVAAARAGRIVKRSKDPARWRERALGIITAASLDFGRQAAVGEVRAVAERNFETAASYLVDNADTLPLSLKTFEALNSMLTKDLPPNGSRQGAWYHGDGKFHEEVRQFYLWLESEAGQRMAREHPVELAERVHFLVSFFDVAAGHNDWTARLMADLALIKAGLAPALYTGIDEYSSRGGARADVLTEERRAYFHEIVKRGQEAMRTDALGHMEMLEYFHAQARLGAEAETHVEEVAAGRPRPRGSAIDYLKWIAAIEGSAARPGFVSRLRGHLGKIREGLREFPSSFKFLVAGISILTGVTTAMAATMAVYGIKEFGLLMAVLATALSLVTRIPGSLVVKWLKPLINTKYIYIAATFLNLIQILLLPLGFWWFGPRTDGYLLFFMVSQAIYGFVWGVTQGVAVEVLMPKVIGQERHTLETGKLVQQAMSTLSALAFAFILGPIISALVGVQASILVYAAIVFVVILILFKIKLLEAGAPAAAAAPQEPAVERPARTRLRLDEMMPFMAVMFTLFSVYTIFVGNFAVYRFNGPDHAGASTGHSALMSFLAIGFYQIGAAVISMGAAIPKLVAMLEHRKNGSSSGFRAKDTTSLRSWFGWFVLAALFYLWTGMAGWQWANILLAAPLLGATIAFNRSQWMAYYMSVLDKKHHEEAVSWLNVWPMVATFVPFGILSLGQIFGPRLAKMLGLGPGSTDYWFLLATVGVTSVGLAAAWLVSRLRFKSRGAAA